MRRWLQMQVAVPANRAPRFCLPPAAHKLCSLWHSTGWLGAGCTGPFASLTVSLKFSFRSQYVRHVTKKKKRNWTIITKEFTEPLEFQLDWAIIFAQLHQLHEYFRSLMNPEKHDGKSWDVAAPVTAAAGTQQRAQCLQEMKGGKEESILQRDQAKGTLRKHEKGTHNFPILWKCIMKPNGNTRGLTAAPCQHLVPKAPLLLQLRAKSADSALLEVLFGLPTHSTAPHAHRALEQEPQVCSVNTHLYPEHAWDVQPHWRWFSTTDHALLCFYTPSFHPTG